MSSKIHLTFHQIKFVNHLNLNNSKLTKYVIFDYVSMNCREFNIL